MTMKLFLDMDGVLVAFEEGVHDLFAKAIKENPEWLKKAIEQKTKMALTSFPHPKEFLKNPQYKGIMWKFVGYAIDSGFWAKLLPMSDMEELWGFCKQFRPSILTAPLESKKEETCLQKKQWVDQHLGLGNIDQFLCVPSNQKQQFVIKNTLSVLIDDKSANIERWNAAGGVGILHTSAASSIEQLKRILDEYSNQQQGSNNT